VTLEEAIQLGVDSAKSHLAIVDAAHGAAIAAAFAGGLATGARNWVAEKHSARMAYDLCQGLADQVVEAA
jgi:hypothetical protein